MKKLIKKTEYIQIEKKDLRELRETLYHAQSCTCPVLGQVIDLSDAVVDHKHKTKIETIGEDGAGLIRGVLHFQANVMEGKISNGFRRYGIHKFGITLPDFLRNLANYLDTHKTNLIHPNEKHKERKLSKRSYNKLKRMAPSFGVTRFPEFPKSGKMIKELERIYKTCKLQPEYLK